MALVLLAFCVVCPAQNTVDVSKLAARPTVDWARDSVIYEISEKASTDISLGGVEGSGVSNDKYDRKTEEYCGEHLNH